MLEPPDGYLTNTEAQQVAAVEQNDRTAVAQGTGTQAAQMDGSASNLLKAAGRGGGSGFKLDPQAAAALAASCQAALDELRSIEADLTLLRNPPQLGTLQGAQAVATYTANVATDGEGMYQALESLKATLSQMHDAYIKASTNYQETNAHIADAMKKIDPGDNQPASTATANATPANPAKVAANQNFN